MIKVKVYNILSSIVIKFYSWYLSLSFKVNFNVKDKI
jgi:hypothetical protein